MRIRQFGPSSGPLDTRQVSSVVLGDVLRVLDMAPIEGAGWALDVVVPVRINYGDEDSTAVSVLAGNLDPLHSRQLDARALKRPGGPSSGTGSGVVR